MALTAAERARRYRAKKKSNEVDREAFLSRERTRQKSRYTAVADLPPRAQRQTRRTWRRNQQVCRRSHELDPAAPATPPPTPPVPYAERRERGRKIIRRDRAKAYRDINKLMVKVVCQKKATLRYKKRCQRLAIKMKAGDSPTKQRTTRLLQGTRRGPAGVEVRRALLFHSALIRQLRVKYAHNRQHGTKQIIGTVASGSVLRKYRVLDQARREIAGYRAHQRRIVRKRREDALSDTVIREIEEFYEQDNNSRLLPGKRDTVTKKACKKQKRLLCETMTVLHAKYLYEHPASPVSYATFCKKRPFWVVPPKLSDRDTCLCKRHSNVQLMADTLHREGVIASARPMEQCAQLVCDTDRKICMYGECDQCDDRRLDMAAATRPTNDTKEVTYMQWTTKDKEIAIASKSTLSDGEPTTKRVKVTVKESRTTTLSDLHEKFEIELKPRFTTHVYNIHHQYRTLRALKEQLPADEVVIHIDFSENYTCRYGEEVQSVHFGASHKQATLHTGLYYKSNPTNVTSFCSISDCNRHDPSGIWAHLQPVLRDIREADEDIHAVHFISDGPTTQYRNKTNFYLASTLPRAMGYDRVTWNFLEASHGKGPADGVGGAIKRQADRFVSEGRDIPDATALYNALASSTDVKLYMIDADSISAVDAMIPTNLRSIPGTMKMHQVGTGTAHGGYASRIHYALRQWVTQTIAIHCMAVF